MSGRQKAVPLSAEREAKKKVREEAQWPRERRSALTRARGVQETVMQSVEGGKKLRVFQFATISSTTLPVSGDTDILTAEPGIIVNQFWFKWP